MDRPGRQPRIDQLFAYPTDSRNDSTLQGLDHQLRWHECRIREEAGLQGVRLHNLRHNWVSVAAMNGIGRATIAKLLGHALGETTERVGGVIAKTMADGGRLP